MKLFEGMQVPPRVNASGVSSACRRVCCKENTELDTLRSKLYDLCHE